MKFSGGIADGKQCVFRPYYKKKRAYLRGLLLMGRFCKRKKQPDRKQCIFALGLAAEANRGTSQIVSKQYRT